jgi:Ca2+-binding RTX toxin-like protein
MTAPIITEALDDVAPQTGEVQYGGYTNDTSPVIRITLGDQLAAGETLRLSDNGAAIGPAITLTAAQLAQGYVDVPVTDLPQGWNLISATITAPGGGTVASTPNFALGVATATPASPTITGAADDSGPAVRMLADGDHTADATLVFQITEPGLPAPPTAPPGHPPYGGPPLLTGHIQLYEGDHLVGDAMIGFGGTVEIASGALSPGEHTLTAVAVDRAGNVSAPSQPFHVFIDQSGQGDGSSETPHSVLGGPGDDVIQGLAVAETLHGGDGNDSIVGGSQFNNINGNAGDDTIVGQSAVGDWLLGGRGADSIDASQSSGHNIINGNIGADTLQAGSGGDTLRGGQGDDVIKGGAGADWLSGDMGHNTLTGGGGADSFHAGDGNDLVTDFSPAQGDRVVVDHGVHWTASQVGADTVVSIDGHGQIILANVQQSSLAAGWIAQL